MHQTSKLALVGRKLYKFMQLTSEKAHKETSKVKRAWIMYFDWRNLPPIPYCFPKNQSTQKQSSARKFMLMLSVDLLCQCHCQCQWLSHALLFCHSNKLPHFTHSFRKSLCWSCFRKAMLQISVSKHINGSKEQYLLGPNTMCTFWG